MCACREEITTEALAAQAAQAATAASYRTPPEKQPVRVVAKGDLLNYRGLSTDFAYGTFQDGQNFWVFTADFRADPDHLEEYAGRGVIVENG